MAEITRNLNVSRSKKPQGFQGAEMSYDFGPLKQNDKRIVSGLMAQNRQKSLIQGADEDHSTTFNLQSKLPRPTLLRDLTTAL